MPLPSREEVSAGEGLDRWVMNPMAMKVATGTFHRAVRVSATGVSAAAGSGSSKSAPSRRFKALTQATCDCVDGIPISRSRIL